MAVLFISGRDGQALVDNGGRYETDMVNCNVVGIDDIASSL